MARLTVTAPIGGVVTELGAREGMTVMAGAPLFRINGLGTVWINAEVPENVATQVRPGNAVEARSARPARHDVQGPRECHPARDHGGHPHAQGAHRARQWRRPTGAGMFATVNFTPAARQEMLLVPSEAVIQTGKRNVVIVAQGEGRFAPVDVEIGGEGADRPKFAADSKPARKSWSPASS